MQDLYNFFLDLAPNKMQTYILSIGGAIGSFIGYVFEGIDKAFYWLLIFVVFDYFTGLLQALKNKNISSKVGYKGIIKKIVIIALVVLSHGLAVTSGIPAIETAAIFAFCLNEFYSILENIERAGFGGIIPPQIAQILAIVDTKQQEKINKIKDE